MKPLVLIVDDERSNLESLGRIFEREEWRVALAETGAAAGVPAVSDALASAPLLPPPQPSANAHNTMDHALFMLTASSRVTAW